MLAIEDVEWRLDGRVVGRGAQDLLLTGVGDGRHKITLVASHENESAEQTVTVRVLRPTEWDREWATTMGEELHGTDLFEKLTKTDKRTP